MQTLEMKPLAERLAVLYLDDYPGVAKLCDEVLDPSGQLLGLVREEARKLGLSPARQKAQEVLNKLCLDPEMWATHGCPPEHKLKRLEDEFTDAFAALSLPS